LNYRGLAAFCCGALDAACSATRAPGGPVSESGAALVGGTGSFAIVSVDGVDKLYLPEYESAGTGRPAVAVVDVGAAGHGTAGAPALITDVDLGGSSDEYATTTAGDSTVVVAASTESPAIWFIDPRTDRLLGETRLPPSSGHTIFGGNGGYVTSIAMDSAHDRAILAVWNGFAIVDVRARRITSVIEVPPSENFAFDPVHGRVVAPFYDCASSVGPDGNSPTACGSTVAPDGSPMTDGLTLIDLEDETVYTYQNPDAELPAAPVGMTPGSAAIDPETGLVIVTAKRKHYQSIIDLAAAHFDARAKTVVAPQTVLRGNGLTDVAIEPHEHLAFWEGENAADVAVGRLATLAPNPAPVGDAGASAERDAEPAAAHDASAPEPDYVFALVPALPDGSAWMNVTTSHGIAVGPPGSSVPAYGVTISRDYRWVARVDLHAMLGLPARDHEADDISSAVTFLDARTKP
jgi:hypothetical protein